MNGRVRSYECSVFSSFTCVLQILFLVSILLNFGACGSEQDPSTSTPPRLPSVPIYQEKGDLSSLKTHGFLRVLSPSYTHQTHLPRKGFPHNHEFELLETFAQSLGLELGFVTVERYEDLIPYLLEGKGDVIAANYTVTPERKKHISFSVPLTTVKEQVVIRLKDSGLTTEKQLKDRTLTVRRSSSFWQTVVELQRQHPGLQIQEAPEHLDTEQILDGVARGEFDATVADSNLIQAVLTYRSDLRPTFTVSPPRAIAWGVRPTASDLLAKLNEYLNQTELSQDRTLLSKKDLPEIRKHQVLRVLTRNNPATYFLWRGKLMGFEYELARHFGQSQKLRIETIVPPTREDLIPWLLEGKGDIIAASMTISEDRKKQGIEFSRPYLLASEILVARANEPEGLLAAPEDLEGRSVAVRASSSYWQTLKALQNRGIAVDIQAAPEDLETEEIIAKVATGEFDLTVADSHILDIELTWREDIKAAFALSEPRELGWAIRASNPQLLKATNQFLRKEYRGLFYNLTLKKYFKNSRNIKKFVELRTTRTGQLSPYDNLVQTFAKQYGFDWRLVVSQMYQESQFNPKARSWAGALGLMQVLPRTAKSLGFHELKTPERGIEAGVKYLNWVRKRFNPELPVDVRMWFTLAAYNAGHGHVKDARRLARNLGLNPDRWFGHVEKAIQLLAKRKYARQAQHGYCRGSEPVKYVREIKRRFEAYQQATTL